MTDRGLRRGNWSVTELERLRQLLPRRGVVDTARLLRRSPESTARKALVLLRQPPRRGSWTDSDDTRLREAWGAVEPRLLGPLLGRSVAEVQRRVADLRRAPNDGVWTRAELQRLKDFYGTRSDEDLEVVVGRPRSEIARVAAQHCLAKDKRFVAQRQSEPAGSAPAPSGRRMPRWTEAEITELRRIYADLDNLEVARTLGRTVTSVANKANQLGLRKSPTILAQIGRANVAQRYADLATDRARGSAAGRGGSAAAPDQAAQQAASQ
ncbi:MAG: hypothetical protein H6838_08770 [Planctomycetes bacterium]|nr:hypothetical protein [Planctomycetota bacterium]MCB9885572.1 hypothetical protein [Planctomycetota bacterium]